MSSGRGETPAGEAPAGLRATPATPGAPTLLIIAKAPVAGRSKTRLCPPCTPEQAADLARAALQDTLAAALACPWVQRRVLVLEGEPGPWLPDGFEVIPQRGDGLDERLAAAFDDVGPGFLVGMDTPQLTPELLWLGLDALAGHDAAYAPSEDGGYWGIGFAAPDAAALVGVPMSEDHTGAAQRARLVERGLSIADLPPLLDVDTIADARTVAAAAPQTRFAAALAAMDVG